MIVRALSTLIIIFLVYKVYQRLFRQKRCAACGKMIAREAAICHHCNTIQDGVELVQAKVETARTALGNRNREGRNGRNSQAMVLLVCAIVMLVLGVAVSIWFMHSL